MLRGKKRIERKGDGQSLYKSGEVKYLVQQRETEYAQSWGATDVMRLTYNV